MREVRGGKRDADSPTAEEVAAANPVKKNAPNRQATTYQEAKIGREGSMITGTNSSYTINRESGGGDDMRKVCENRDQNRWGRQGNMMGRQRPELQGGTGRQSKVETTQTGIGTPICAQTHVQGGDSFECVIRPDISEGVFWTNTAEGVFRTNTVQSVVFLQGQLWPRRCW